MPHAITEIESLFERALPLSVQEQDRFLQELRRDKPELARQLEALLHAGKHSEQFFARDPAELASCGCLTVSVGHPDRIGRYKIVEKIGEGGMGVVYMAEQEEPVRRKVALKIIKLGMDTRQVVARFEAERQALALMDHPNIAKVFDGGMTDPTHSASDLPAPEIGQQPGHPLPSSDEERGQGEGSRSLTTHYGRPYFVMELVQGVPITEFCEKNQLSVQGRIKLFIPVCQAIQSAHQKGIIHRDLKPSNVLVTLHDGVPVPKVIDFGVAKAINQKLTERTLFTNFATMIGTPAYMSPEQAEMTGLDIDTRSDIYSLGVLLYELLTGTTPFLEKRLRSVAYSEMQRIIVEEEPERPSTRLRRTSLAASPGRLAPHPSSLAADLDWIVMKCLEKDRNRRYESANGVAADIERYLNSEPVVARPPSAAYRFGKMARRNRAAFAAAAAVFLALAAGAVVSTWQAVKAKRAEQTARQQTEMARSVKDFILDQVLGRVHPFAEPEFDTNKRALVDRISRAVEGAFTNQPLIEAEVRYALGEAFDALDQWDKSREQQEKAVAIRKRLLPRGHSDTILAEAKLAVAYRHLGRRDESEALLAEGIAAARSSLQPLSGGAAAALFLRGYNLTQDGRPGEALHDLREALEILNRTAGADHIMVTEVLWTIALATSGLGRTNEAARLLEDGRQRSEKLHGTNHPWTGFFLKSQGVLFINQGRLEEGVQKLEQARSIHARTMGPDSYLTLNDVEFLAPNYERQGRTNEAAESYADLARGWSTHFPYHNSRSRCSEVAAWFVRHGRLEQAKAIFAQIRTSYEANPPKQSEEEFNAFIAATAASNGWPAAAGLCRENLDRFGGSLNVWLHKAWVFRYVGDEESYRQTVEKILSSPHKKPSANDQHLPIEIAALGSFPFSAEQVKQLDSMMDALAAALPGRPVNEQALAYRAIGQMQLQLERLAKCLEALERSALHHSSPDPYALFLKALCLHRLGRSDEARAAFEKGEAMMKPLLPESLNQFEGFLPTWQIYQHRLMHRETEAVLVGAKSKL